MNLDPNFRDVIRALNSIALDYWVCHGTLLGIVREGNLIDWDHDIDIGLLAVKFPFEQTIKYMMCNLGFLETDSPGASLHFDRAGGRRVDFNFYEPKGDEYWVPWIVIRRNILTRILGRLKNELDLLASSKITPRFCARASQKMADLLQLALFSPCLTKTEGYSLPQTLLKKFHYVEISDIHVRIPSNFHEICARVYGSDWRVPKEKFNWQVDSSSVRQG